jgi:hypothetical protein
VDEKTRSAKSQLELQEKLRLTSKSVIALMSPNCTHEVECRPVCALHWFTLPVHQATFFSHQMQWWSYEESLSTCLASCFQNLQQAFSFKAFQSCHGFDTSPIWKTMLITNTITTITTSARE